MKTGFSQGKKSCFHYRDGFAVQVIAPQLSYGKNMYIAQLALLLSWCCKDDDPNDYCIVTSLLQGRWISGDDARNHKREGGGIVNCHSAQSNLRTVFVKILKRLSLSADLCIHSYWLSRLRQASHRKMIQSSALRLRLWRFKILTCPLLKSCLFVWLRRISERSWQWATFSWLKN